MTHIHLLRAVLLLLPLSLAACTIVDETAQTPTTCDVHHVAMKRDTVPIAYGDRVFDPRYAAAAERGFPYANLESRRGCVVESDSPTHARVLYCPECRKAEAAFVREREQQQQQRAK